MHKALSGMHKPFLNLAELQRRSMGFIARNRSRALIRHDSDCAKSIRPHKTSIRSSRRVAAERSPCFHRAFRLAASPSGVTGPVDAPPCIRHRVYLCDLSDHIAGALHGDPHRVLAPHV